jgi:probable F420-dependent oxidoreductase
VRVGIHLPQYGHVSGPDSITKAAIAAESLGYAGIWVSDHTIHPAAQSYPSPHLYDPLVSLTWAAAATRRIGLGTSVWVAPAHSPVESANAFASLDALSGGRLTIGVGTGWSRAEFDALGQPFDGRGLRTDDMLRAWRTLWDDDPASFHGAGIDFDEIRLLPKPAHRIALWIGGSGSLARRRAVELGDGYHLIGVTPEQAAEVIPLVRALRPESNFVVSLRTGWDPQGMEHDRIRAERDAYEAAGIGYVVAAPWRRTLDEWLRSMELLSGLVQFDTNR